MIHVLILVLFHTQSGLVYAQHGNRGGGNDFPSADSISFAKVNPVHPYSIQVLQYLRMVCCEQPDLAECRHSAVLALVQNCN